MSNVTETNKNKQKLLKTKVENKLSALKSFIEGGEPPFDIPDKFTWNWFVSLSEGCLETFSKGSQSVRSGTELRTRIDSKLAECEKKRKEDQLISKRHQPRLEDLEREKKFLKGQLNRLKKQLDTKTDEIIELRRVIMDLQNQTGISQAQWEDQKVARITKKEEEFE